MKSSNTQTVARSFKFPATLQLALAFVHLSQDTSVDVILETDNLGCLFDQRRSSEKREIFKYTLFNARVHS